MWTDFLYKKAKGLAIALLVAVTVGVGGYALRLNNTVCVETAFDFYFVSVEEGGLASCVQQVALDGGAGYVYEEKVVLGTYFSIEEGEQVCREVAKLYPSARVVTLSTGVLFLPKEKEERIMETLKSAYRQIQGFSAIASELDDGGTQESAKQTIACYQDSLRTLEATYAERSPGADFFAFMQSEISKMDEEVVFAKEIRYQTCRFAETFCAFARSQSV